MEMWAAGFIAWGLLMAGIAWMVPSLFWWRRLRLGLRVLIASAMSLFALSAVGALLSASVHALDQGVSVFADAAFSNPVGAVIYSAEAGWETGVFWLPAMLLKVMILGERDQPRRGRG